MKVESTFSSLSSFLSPVFFVSFSQLFRCLFGGNGGNDYLCTVKCEEKQ